MLVLNLACEQGHGFEGWFGSAGDFDQQRERGLLSCPLCSSPHVSRRPSAPRLNLSGAPREPESGPPAPQTTPSAANGTPQPVLPQQLQQRLMQAVRQVMAQTEDVGERFAEEARRIHYGEAQQRGIRGQTSVDEARALADEGIEVLALPVPDALKGPLQ